MTLPAESIFWSRLRAHTAARIGLAQNGASIGTKAHLDFMMAHAHARDAVHTPLNPDALMDGLQARGLNALHLRSAAVDRRTYLARPDLGRRLSEVSYQGLAGAHGTYDLAIVIADGLSAAAVITHALPLIARIQTLLASWSIGPVAVVEQGRVAIGDEIGAALGASLALVLIGERPGLSSPDSLGAYITWAPRPGRSDADRNCISNIRPEGLGYDKAGQKLAHLLTMARASALTGIRLKDTSEGPLALNPLPSDLP